MSGKNPRKHFCIAGLSCKHICMYTYHILYMDRLRTYANKYFISISLCVRSWSAPTTAQERSPAGADRRPSARSARPRAPGGAPPGETLPPLLPPRSLHRWSDESYTNQRNIHYYSYKPCKSGLAFCAC